MTFEQFYFTPTIQPAQDRVDLLPQSSIEDLSAAPGHDHYMIRFNQRILT
jgi:hypothetical protein